MIKPKLFLKYSGPAPKAPSPPDRRAGGSLPLDFLDGEGVFETFRSYGGKILGLSDHLRRLDESARGIGRALPWPHAGIGRWMRDCLKRSGTPDALLRLMAVWGRQSSVFSREHFFKADDSRLKTHDKVALVLFIRSFRPWSPADYRRGVSIRTASAYKNSIKAASAFIKSNQYVNAIGGYVEREVRGEGAARDPFEIVFLSNEGFLTEGTVSNVMMVKDGAIFTPEPSCGILLGVTRLMVRKAALAAGVSFAETRLTRHDLYTADEAFITTTLSEVMPVTRCDGRTIGTGRAGPVTRHIHSVYRRLAKERHLE